MLRLLYVHITFELDLKYSMMSIYIENDDDDDEEKKKKFGEAIKDVKECRTKKKIVNNTHTHSHTHGANDEIFWGRKKSYNVK